MKTVICYPVPMQDDHNWEIFRPCVERFIATWQQFPPGVDCTLAAVCLENDVDDSTRKMFCHLPVEWLRYDGEGYDVGAAQWLSRHIGNAFLIGMNSRVFFHRAGWLSRLVEAHDRHGPTLYGTSASKENRLHIRTACYGIESLDLAGYPYAINSRADGYKFESGEECLLDFVELELGWPSCLVTWQGVLRKEAWLALPNGFRRGTQEDVLVWDEHIVRYARADDEEREALYRAAYLGVETVVNKE